MNPEKISKEDKLRAFISEINTELNGLTMELDFRVQRIKKLVDEAQKCV